MRDHAKTMNELFRESLEFYCVLRVLHSEIGRSCYAVIEWCLVQLRAQQYNMNRLIFHYWLIDEGAGGGDGKILRGF